MAIDQSLIDLILIIVVVEFIVLCAFLLRAGKASLVPALASFLLSGALILGALRLVLAESVSSSELLPGLLGLSFPMHIATLVLAWRALPKDSHRR
jgi:RsiW-degrading membrane proteinase PrsW (M82 family)